MPKFAANIDANQPAIVGALRAVGASVTHTHMVGRGFPDIVCGFRGLTFLLEIKDGSKPPSRRKLTEVEREWHAAWRGHVAVVENEAEALRAIGIESYRDLHTRIVGNEAAVEGVDAPADGLTTRN